MIHNEVKALAYQCSFVLAEQIQYLQHLTLYQGSHASWKVMEFKKGIFRPRKSWKMTVIMETRGKVMEFHQ